MKLPNTKALPNSTPAAGGPAVPPPGSGTEPEDALYPEEAQPNSFCLSRENETYAFLSVFNDSTAQPSATCAAGALFESLLAIGGGAKLHSVLSEPPEAQPETKPAGHVTQHHCQLDPDDPASTGPMEIDVNRGLRPSSDTMEPTRATSKKKRAGGPAATLERSAKAAKKSKANAGGPNARKPKRMKKAKQCNMPPSNDAEHQLPEADSALPGTTSVQPRPGLKQNQDTRRGLVLLSRCKRAPAQVEADNLALLAYDNKFFQPHYDRMAEEHKAQKRRKLPDLTDLVTSCLKPEHMDFLLQTRYFPQQKHLVTIERGVNSKNCQWKVMAAILSDFYQRRDGRPAGSIDEQQAASHFAKPASRSHSLQPFFLAELEAAGLCWPLGLDKEGEFLPAQPSAPLAVEAGALPDNPGTVSSPLLFPCLPLEEDTASAKEELEGKPEAAAAAGCCPDDQLTFILSLLDCKLSEEPEDVKPSPPEEAKANPCCFICQQETGDCLGVLCDAKAEPPADCCVGPCLDVLSAESDAPGDCDGCPGPGGSLLEPEPAGPCSHQGWQLEPNPSSTDHRTVSVYMDAEVTQWRQSVAEPDPVDVKQVQKLLFADQVEPFDNWPELYL